MTCRIPTIDRLGRHLCTGLLLLLAAGTARGGDEDLLGATIPPNVALFVDSSLSMNAVMTHPSFVATDHPSDDSAWGPGLEDNCDIIPVGTNSTDDDFEDDDDEDIRRECWTGPVCMFAIDSDTDDWTATSSTSDHSLNGYVERTYCGRTRRLYTDGSSEDDGNRTIYFENYLEWLFSLDETDSTTLWGPPEHQRTAQQILDEIDAAANGRNYITGDTFGSFQRTRIAAARDIANQVIYQTNTDCAAYGGDCGVYEDRVRFGIGRFDGDDGGYISAELDSYSSNKADLESAINGLEGEGFTPLGESLFKLYTYFMDRDDSSDRPLGQDGSTRFPAYQYDLDGDWQSSSSDWTADPVLQECQKNFVVMVTDGEPTRDTFDGTNSNNTGFSSFDDLVGDYYTDAAGDADVGADATPEVGNPPWERDDGAGYLDDIAHFMQTHDLRPNETDFPGDQYVDTYTVGFTTSGPVNALLEKAADNGNGLYFEGSQAEELTEALVSSIRDIFSKSQGFAAAAVPAARTAGGGQLYTTIFMPSTGSAFWPGVIRSYTITAAGDILDADGDCALQGSNDPTDCKSGEFKNTTVAPPHWDASEAMPDAPSRSLYTSRISSGATTRVSFGPSLDASDLAISLADIASSVVSLLGLSVDDEAARVATAFARGCELGTGTATGYSDCVHRQEIVEGTTFKRRLGDVFHSNPIVVGPPASYVNEPSYRAFQALSNVATRQRLLYAGANDGFLHAFDAGSWDSSAGSYTVGTGAEVFGFMPWQARKRIKELAQDGGDHPFFVDGSPAAADVWIDGDNDDTNAKTASEWHTILVNGMRDGGSQYFALDVTDPSASGFPGLLWEFPTENDSALIKSYVGNTWSDPIITKIRAETAAGDVVDRWVVAFGLGYHETGDPNDSAYDPNAAAGRGIVILDAATGDVIAARVFGTGTNEVSDMLYAIPSAPAVIDYDQDGYADLLYVGDLGGNVWKWVIDEPASLDASETHQPGWEFRKFFDANPGATATTHRRSFYYAPRATKWSNKLFLGFGSGERNDLLCVAADGCDVNNRFYVVRDLDPWDNGTPSTIDGREYTTGDLTNVTAYQDTCPTVEPKGYFFDLPLGAKFTTNSVVFDGFFFVTAFDPAGATKCDPSGSSEVFGFLVQCGQGFFGNESSLSPIANDSRSQSLGGGFSTDPRISIAPGEGGNRLIISKQDGEIFNWETGTGRNEHGTLYWRELRE